MVGDDDLDALAFQVFDLIGGGDAVIDRDDQIGVQPNNALDRLSRKTVALFEAQGNEGDDLCPERSEPTRHNRSCRYAVHVEIAEDEDARTTFERCEQSFDDLFHAFDVMRVAPIAHERWVEEPLHLLILNDPARSERSSYEMRKVEGLGKMGYHCLVDLLDQNLR